MYPIRCLADLGSAALWSEEGTRQGDPLAPLLFALGVHGTVERAANSPGVESCLFYADDGYLVGAPEQLCKVYKDLKTSFASVGLQLNPSKSVLYTPELKRLDESEQASLERSIHHELDGQPLQVTSEGITVLGSPINTNDFIQRTLEGKVRSTEHLVEQVITQLGEWKQEHSCFCVTAPSPRLCIGYASATHARLNMSPSVKTIP